jgi:ABC-type nitrate/sulfonate/bicarbonate transport system permease component
MSSMTTTREGDVVVEAAPSKAAEVEPTPGGGAPVRARQRRRRVSMKMQYRLISTASVVGVLVAWQILSSQNVINQAIFSSPSDIWNAARQMVSDGTLGSTVASSAALYGVGLGLSILIGIVGGVTFGWWRRVGAVFDPWIAILNATPLVALLPLLLVWFGIGFESQVVMVVLVSVFPLLVNVMAGTRQVDAGLLTLSKSFRGSQLAILRTLVLPSLIPYIVTGVRLASAFGLIGITIAEYFEGNNGIGGLILREGTELNTSAVFVGIVILAGAGLTITAILRGIETRISGWREDV